MSTVSKEINIEKRNESGGNEKAHISDKEKDLIDFFGSARLVYAAV